MKIAFLADVHLGNPKAFGGPVASGLNDRGRLVLGALATAYHQAREVGCEQVIIAGDFFDTSRPEPQLIAEAQRIVREIPTIILLGNHDMVSDAPGDHALGPMEPVARIVSRPVDPKIGGIRFLLAPFQTEAVGEWLPGLMQASPPEVLVGHFGIQDGNTPPWLQGARDAFALESLMDLMITFETKACFVGNWHEPQRWQNPYTQVVQVGCTAPTGWNNPGLRYGTMAVFDTRSWAVSVLTVPGPRFVVTEEEAREASKDCKAFLRLSASSDAEEVRAAQAKVEALQAELGVVGEVVPDTSRAQAAMRTAAGLARSAETVDQALWDFVAAMPVEAEDLRPKILARVKKYMGGA